jgi:hypothetical protein
MFPEMNVRDPPCTAPPERRESFLQLAYYKHFVPNGTKQLRRKLAKKTEVGCLLHRERKGRAE